MFGADHMNTVSVIGMQTRGWISTNKMIFRKFHLHVAVGEVPDSLQPWGPGETCIASEFGGDEIICLTSRGWTPGEPEPTDHLLLGPQPSTLAVTPAPPSSLVFFCHKENIGASALLLILFLNLFRPRGEEQGSQRAPETLPLTARGGCGVGNPHTRPKCGKTSVFSAASHGVGSRFSQTLREISASGCEAVCSPEPWPVQGSPGP